MEGWIRGFRVTNSDRSNMEITHLLYADDFLIFFDAKVEQVSHIRLILLLFEAISGLDVNWRKSQTFTENNVPNIQSLSCSLGCELGVLPNTFLGLPLGAKSKSQ